MKNIFLISFLLAYFFSLTAHAAAPLPDNDFSTQSATAVEATGDEVRWYQVELLIFKQRPVSAEIDEIWPKNITLSYPNNWDTLKTPDEYQAIYKKNSVVNTPFILLDKKYQQLSSFKNKLQLNRNDILFHGAWRQSLRQSLGQKDAAEVTSLLIRGGDQFDGHSELEGSISLSLLRYLHINTNLWLTRFAPASTVADTAVDAGENTPTGQPTIINWPELPEFPLQTSKTTETAAPGNITPLVAEKGYQVEEIVTNRQSRRMRSYETHYIDHPKFGILVRMVPLDTNTMLPIPPKN